VTFFNTKFSKILHKVSL